MPDESKGVLGEIPPGSVPLPRRSFADLLPRVASALVLMAAALISVWQGGLIFGLIWLSAVLAVAYEWQQLIGTERPLCRFFLAAFGIVLSLAAARQKAYAIAGAVLLASALGTGLMARPPRRIWAFAGVIYAGALLLSLVALEGGARYGTISILWLYAVVWGTDVFAYFGGRLIGGAKLWPAVSPSKTWSGTLTGIGTGAVLGTVLASAWLEWQTRFLPLLLLGVAATAVSQAGDIFESSVKRRFGAKDSSRLIPGHGGFMDRLDGFIATAVFAALFGTLRGLSSVAAGLFSWP